MEDSWKGALLIGFILGVFAFIVLLGFVSGWKPVAALKADAEDWFNCEAPKFIIAGMDTSGTKLDVYQCADGTVIGRVKEPGS